MVTGLLLAFFFLVFLPVAIAMAVVPIWLIIRPLTDKKKRKVATAIMFAAYIFISAGYAIQMAIQHHVNVLKEFVLTLAPFAFFYGFIWLIVSYFRWARDNPEHALKVVGIASIALYAAQSYNRAYSRQNYARTGINLHGDE